MNYWKCVLNFPLFWLAPNGLNELPEMRFEFPVILIGKKSWVAFLADQLWHVLKCWYTGGGPKKDFGAVSQTGFTRVKFRWWRRLSRPQRSSRELAHSLTEGKLSLFSLCCLLLVLGPVGCGKTALAVQMALMSDFPFIKMCTPENMIGFIESAKCQTIKKVSSLPSI